MASLMLVAIVIRAPVAYIKVVTVKKLAVGSLAQHHKRLICSRYDNSREIQCKRTHHIISHWADVRGFA